MKLFIINLMICEEHCFVRKHVLPNDKMFHLLLFKQIIFQLVFEFL